MSTGQKRKHSAPPSIEEHADDLDEFVKLICKLPDAAGQHSSSRAANVREIVTRAYKACGGVAGFRALFALLLEQFGTNVVVEYVRFCVLKTILRDVHAPVALSPSGPVDRVWHAHMLEPHHYLQMCTALLGEAAVFFHSATTAQSSDRSERYARTRDLYRVFYGIKCPALEWPDEANTVPTTIRVKALTGDIVDIPFSDDLTAEHLKRAYYDATGFAISHQRLIFAGRQLEDGCVLKALGARAGSTIHMVGMLRGC